MVATLVKCYFQFSDFSDSAVPTPSVKISAIQTGSLSAGTPLTLTCTTTLSSSVNDGEVVNTVWTGPDMTEMSSGSRVTVSGAVDSTPPYVSELTISPLGENDSGDYNCTVMVVPRAGRESVATDSAAVSQEEMVYVEGETIRYLKPQCFPPYTNLLVFHSPYHSSGSHHYNRHNNSRRCVHTDLHCDSSGGSCCPANSRVGGL